MNKSESITKLAGALVQAQSEFDCVRHDSDNPFFKSKYASLGAMIVSTVPILKKHGLAISQLPTSDITGQVGVETILMHESGEWISQPATVTLPGHVNKKSEWTEQSQNPAQEAGKAITYLRRYGWQAVLGVYSGDDDDAQSLGQLAESLGGKKVAKKWTEIQKGWLITSNFSENLFSAKAMLDKSTLPVNAGKVVVESWGKYYRAARDQDKTSDEAATEANGKYAAAMAKAKK